MQHSDQSLNTLYSPVSLPDSYSYDWSFVPTAFADSNSDDFLDFLLLDDSSTTTIPQETQRAASIAESIISDTSSTTTHQTTFSESYFAQAPSSASPPPSFQTSNASSGRGVLIPGLPTEQDRKHRRREQNRKAQSVFRQKRKCEVRKLQEEVAQLKKQLAKTRRDSTLASWTICAKCRNFYPPTVCEGERSPTLLSSHSHLDWAVPGPIASNV